MRRVVRFRVGVLFVAWQVFWPGLGYAGGSFRLRDHRIERNVIVGAIGISRRVDGENVQVLRVFSDQRHAHVQFPRSLRRPGWTGTNSNVLLEFRGNSLVFRDEAVGSLEEETLFVDGTRYLIDVRPHVPSGATDRGLYDISVSLGEHQVLSGTSSQLCCGPKETRRARRDLRERVSYYLFWQSRFDPERVEVRGEPAPKKKAPKP
ncbi:MAG: hypothetical protein AAF654_13285 [Myxococcota bacterium]